MCSCPDHGPDEERIRTKTHLSDSALINIVLCGRLAPFHMATQPEVLQKDSAARTTLATPFTPRVSLKDWFRCATIVLIALNVLVFLMMVLQGVPVFNPTADSVLRWGADYGRVRRHCYPSFQTYIWSRRRGHEYPVHFSDIHRVWIEWFDQYLK